MRAGKLRHRVTLQKPSRVSKNEFNEVDPVNYIKTGDYYAEVTPVVLKGGEELIAGQTQAVNSHQVRMRYSSDVKEDCRFLFEGRSLQINKIDDTDNRHIELVIQCSEIKVV